MAGEGPVGETWLGRRFAGIIEEETDKKKLARAKKCFKSGASCRLSIKPGYYKIGICCTGYVIKDVTFWFNVLPVSQSDRLIRIIASDTALLGSILSSEISEFFIQRLEEKKINLLPGTIKELTAFCNCSDSYMPCIHMINAWYILAEALDEDPWYLFTLRGLLKEQIIKRIKLSREYNLLLSDMSQENKTGKKTGDHTDIPDNINPDYFFSIQKNKNIPPKFPDDEPEINIMAHLGRSPFFLGGKNMSERIEALYPKIKQYAKGLTHEEDDA